MVSLVDVRGWSAAGVESALRALTAARDALVELDADLAAARPPDAWTGAGADAARAGQEQVAERLRRLVAGVAAARPAVAEVADAIPALHAALAAAEALARDHGFVVAADGSIGDTVGDPAADPAAWQRAAVRAEVMDRLEQVLRRAAQVDTDLAVALDRIAAGHVDDGPSATLAAAATTGDAAGAAATPPPVPPAGAGPGDAAGWWAALSAADRERVLTAHPEWVGHLDGLPAAVRDRANRARLAADTARLDAALADVAARLAAVEAHPPVAPGQRAGVAGDWVAERGRLRAELAALRDRRATAGAVAAVVARPDRHLLLLDLDRPQPRAAVAVGDVDTADHVAVATPGFSSNVRAGLDGYTTDADDLRNTAQRLLQRAGRGGETVATVAWLGYDSPQWGDPLPATGTAAAARGGVDLARFYDGIDAGRAADPHLTALGHSYGSTTTGFGLQGAHGVDDAVFYGSPGIGTGDVTALHVPAGHVGVISAPSDPIADTAVLGPDPDRLGGVVTLSARDAVAADGTSLAESHGHSEYLLPDTTSQYNIAATVAGLPGHHVPEPYPQGPPPVPAVPLPGSPIRLPPPR